MLLPKSWVCYVALMNLQRDQAALENKVKKWTLAWKRIIIMIIKYPIQQSVSWSWLQKIGNSNNKKIEGWPVKYLTAKTVVSVSFAWNQ